MSDNRNVKEYLFSPEKDITAEELAKILELLGMRVEEPYYLSLEENVKRHFK